MNTPAIMLVLAAIALQGATATGKTPKPEKKSMPPEEKALRQYLNEHVIVIPPEGMAIEPLDYYRSPWCNRKETPLQVSDPKGPPKGLLCKESAGEKLTKEDKLALRRWEEAKEPWDTAMDQSGCVGMPPIAHPANELSFFFRDYVVQRMLAKARGKKILIFVHGGMNSLADGIERAYWLAAKIESQGYYPIFVCWKSDLISSWWQHITSIRNGRDASKDYKVLRTLTGSVYAVTDLATAAVQMPRTMLDLLYASGKPTMESQYMEVLDAKVREHHLLRAANSSSPPANDKLARQINDMRGREHALDWLFDIRKPGEPLPTPPVPFNLEHSAASLEKGWHEIKQNPQTGHWQTMAVSRGEYRKDFGDEIMRQLGGWGFIAPKLLVVGAFAGLGSEAWDVMLRRVDMMYHHERSLQPMYASTSYKSEATHHYSEVDQDVRHSTGTGVGAMSVLLRSIQVAQSKGQTGPVTLIGHSMGSIVLNRALAYFPELRADQIVYLAAAATVRDTYDTVVPYLRAHPQAQFYNVCLNPRTDDREMSLEKSCPWPIPEFVPRGSLLVWIDSFLNQPNSLQGRTIGYFENALLTSPMFPPSIQRQVRMISLSGGPQSGETVLHHGDFGKHRFWEKKFYSSDGAQLRAGFQQDRPIGKIPKDADGPPDY